MDVCPQCDTHSHTKAHSLNHMHSSVLDIAMTTFPPTQRPTQRAPSFIVWMCSCKQTQCFSFACLCPSPLPVSVLYFLIFCLCFHLPFVFLFLHLLMSLIHLRRQVHWKSSNFPAHSLCCASLLPVDVTTWDWCSRRLLFASSATSQKPHTEEYCCDWRVWDCICVYSTCERKKLKGTRSKKGDMRKIREFQAEINHLDSKMS